MAKQTEDYEWTGRYLLGARIACVIRFRPPTDRRPPQWAATLRRGARPDQIFRATVPYSDGPLAAAIAVATKAGCSHWKPEHVLSTGKGDDEYCVSFRSS
jgi:hypothetical protein